VISDGLGPLHPAPHPSFPLGRLYPQPHPIKPRHDKRNRRNAKSITTHLEPVAEREEVDGGGRGRGGGHGGGEAEREDAVRGREEGERGLRGGEGGGAEGKGFLRKWPRNDGPRVPGTPAVGFMLVCVLDHVARRGSNMLQRHCIFSM
jgi:hypothetical protein